MRPENRVSLWAIRNWDCSPGSYGFNIWVSPQFLSLAQAATKILDKQAAQNHFRFCAKFGGATVYPNQELVLFDEWGAVQINHPHGGGKWTNLNVLDQRGFPERGGEYSTHNIDTASEQSLLFKLWLTWAQFVETSIEVTPST